MDTNEFIQRAENGDAQCQLKLGLLLLAKGYPDDISDACVYWLERAADRPFDAVSSLAVKELVLLYLRYPGADAHYVIKRFGRFANHKNPLALLALGRILFGDEESPYVMKFGQGRTQHDFRKALLTININTAPLSPRLKDSERMELGFVMAEEAVTLAEELGENNPFNNGDYYAVSALYGARIAKDTHYFGKRSEHIQSLLEKYLTYAEKACQWAETHGAAEAHRLACEALLSKAQKLNAEYKTG